jgi:hypothetical protein
LQLLNRGPDPGNVDFSWWSRHVRAC